MEKFYPTNAGLDYAAQTAIGKRIVFTKGKFGDGVRTHETITDLTDLIHPLGELPISKKDTNANTIIITTQFSNKVGSILIDTFYLSEIGLYAKLLNEDGSEDTEHPEILVGYAFDNPGDKIPGNILTEFIINFPLTVAEAGNVSVVISSIAYTSQKDFNNEVLERQAADTSIQAQLDSHKNNKVNPHNVTKSQVGLGNVPNVVTNDQTPTFTSSSSLTNLTSGEKISVTFGKIAKAISDFISHKSNKSNPHSVTKLQVGLGNVDNTSDINKPVSDAVRAALAKEFSERENADIEIYRNIDNHRANENNPHIVTKEQVGLGSVDNTSDMNKPISIAVQDALDMEAETRYDNDSNIQYKIDVHTQSETNPHGVTKAQVGLGNVPNVVTNDQTPTYDTASTLTALTSGEKLSVAFGKMAKAISDFITHVGKTSDSTSASYLSSSDTNYPTVRDIFYGLPNINGSHTYTSSTNIYAPTSAGTTGYNLVSNGGAPVWQAPPYGVCSTSGGTTAKTVSVTNFKLLTGARIYVKFTYEHTGSTAATLNINGTGAKNIVVHNKDNVNINIKNYYTWSAGETVEFLYDGSYWVAISSDMNLVNGAQSATVIIGTTMTPGYCDFRCDGTNDNTMFSNAISRLKTILSRTRPDTSQTTWTRGGSILVKTGFYHITTTLNFDSSISGYFYEFVGEGRSASIIQNDGTEGFAHVFESLRFRDMGFWCEDLNNGPYFNEGYELIFDNCVLNINSRTTTVGCLANVTNCAVTGGGDEDISKYPRRNGTVTMSNCLIQLKVTNATASSAECFSGIKCRHLNIDNCEISLSNNSSVAGVDLNFAYDVSVDGHISGSNITCSKGTNIIAGGNVNMVGNTIYLRDTSAKISHYSTSAIEHGGTFTGNTVYCKYYVYLRMATITGNKFLKLPSIAKTSNSCYLYCTCPTTITGNFFDGGTNSDSSAKGTWYLNCNGRKIICQDNIYIGGLSKSSYSTSSLVDNNLEVSGT